MGVVGHRPTQQGVSHFLVTTPISPPSGPAPHLYTVLKKLADSRLSQGAARVRGAELL
jgi:hypothetical protein